MLTTRHRLLAVVLGVMTAPTTLPTVIYHILHLPKIHTRMCAALRMGLPVSMLLNKLTVMR